MIESADGHGERWSTVGVSANIIDASYRALHDSIVYKLFRDGRRDVARQPTDSRVMAPTEAARDGVTRRPGDHPRRAAARREHRHGRAGHAELRPHRPAAGPAARVWPNEKAVAAASGADRVLDAARLFASTAEAIADLDHVYATTARTADMTKRSMTPRQAAAEMRGAIRSRGGPRHPVRHGSDRPTNDDIALAEPSHRAPEPGLQLAEPRAGGAARRLRVVPDRRRDARPVSRYGASRRPRRRSWLICLTISSRS